MSGGWDDLFDLAAGKQSETLKSLTVPSSATNIKTTVSPNEPPHSAKRTTKQSRRQKDKQMLIHQRKLSNSNSNSNPNRMNIPDSTIFFPSWARLGAGIVKASCPQWQTGGTNAQHCKHCLKPALFHRLHVTPNDRQTDFITTAFCFLRNIRCAAVLASTMGLKGLEEVAHIDAIALSRQSLGPVSVSVSPGELLLLKEKANSILKLTEGRTSAIENFIRMIIACDALYLRLYYLQISGGLENVDHLPNPMEYFSPNLNTAADSEQVFSKICAAVSSDDEILKRFGLETSTHTVHPLSYLHRQRLIETHSLFHTLMDNNTQVEVNEHKGHSVSSLDDHETPAPVTLAEWRDSCRDMLCNLYAYATLSSESLAELKTVLETHGIYSIIELGAGTGYMAKTLADIGLAVEAFDIAPPSHSMNEYHGMTTPFYPVQAGDTACLQGRTITNQALLLCYPPPQSEMAHDAAVAFMKAGGTCIIHVGEFSGLTGSLSFETLLKRDFKCQLRRPCLTWGTDASSLTLWVRSSTPQSSLLLPCVKCGNHEATRRLRIARYVVYCSDNCFRQHEETLKKHFLIGMVAVNVQSLDFNNEHHFSPLPLRGTASKRRRDKDTFVTPTLANVTKKRKRKETKAKPF